MSNPFIGEIRMFGGSFAPAGWALCNGAIMPISENDALFTLIGTTYGGDGQETFGLPNFSARVPVDAGTSPISGTTFQLGELAGTQSVTLTSQQMPVHTHAALGSIDIGSSSSPTSNIPASYPGAQGRNPYGTDEPFVTLDPSSVGGVGGGQPHDNMQPFLVVTFIISLFGIFPHQ